MTPLEIAYAKLVERSIEKPCDYSNCPECDRLKCKRSKLCMFCKRKGRAPIEQPDDQTYRIIPLTKGQVTEVSASDYEPYMQWKWCAAFIPRMNSYYAFRGGEDGKSTLMHREILGLKFGDPREGDHIDGNTLNNRRENLRIATISQNRTNKKKQKNNTSGFNGVDFSKWRGQWRARTKKNKTEIVIGYFDTKEEARDAQIAKAREIHGDFVPNRE